MAFIFTAIALLVGTSNTFAPLSAELPSEEHAPPDDPVLIDPDSVEAAMEDHAPFQLSLKQQQMIGVELGTAERKPVAKEIYAPGRVAFEPEIYTAVVEYLEALDQLRETRESPLPEARRSARRMVESAKTRLKILGLSDEQIEALTKPDGADTALLLPEADKSAWVYAEIYEMDLPHVRAGMDAQIRSPALGAVTLNGQVIAVDNVLDEETRTATAQILVRAPPGVQLHPQSYVQVWIAAELGTELVVPFYAVLDTGKKAWVFVVHENGIFEPRLVEVETYAGDLAVIAEGLEEGERIVTSANFLIDSESRLRAAFTRGEKTAPQCPEGQYWDFSMNMCMPGEGPPRPEERQAGRVPECPEGQSWDPNMNMCM